MIRRLYDWTLRLGERPRADVGLCFLSFIESVFFPIPPDPLLFAMGVAKPKRAVFYAFLTTAFSVVGGIAGYAVGFMFWESVGPFFVEYVVRQEHVDYVYQQFDRNAFLAIFLAGLTPIPYKVFTLSAGIAHISLPTFILGSIVGRGMRFFFIGSALYFFGPKVKPWVERHLTKVTLIAGALVAVVFVVYKWLQ